MISIGIYCLPPIHRAPSTRDTGSQPVFNCSTCLCSALCLLFIHVVPSQNAAHHPFIRCVPLLLPAAAQALPLAVSNSYINIHQRNTTARQAGFSGLSSSEGYGRKAPPSKASAVEATPQTLCARAAFVSVLSEVTSRWSFWGSVLAPVALFQTP